MSANKSQTGVQVDDSSKVETPSLTAGPLDEKTKDFKELLEDEMAKVVDEIKEEFNKRDTSQTGERGKYRLKLMKEKISNLRGLNQKALEEYQASVKAGRTDLAELSKRLREDLAKQTKTKLKNLKAVIDSKAGAEITTNEVRDLEIALKALEEFEKNHPRLQPIFDKVGEGQNLSKQELELVAGMIKPHTITETNKQPVSFEATAAGLLISMMKPAQRYEMVDGIIDSPQAKQSAEMIDMFLRVGILTRIQGEKLFEKAVEKGAVSKEKFEKDFKKKLDSGYYEQELVKVKAIMEEEVHKKFAGQYADNLLNRFDVPTIVGILLTGWGSATAIFNLLASGGDGLLSVPMNFLASGYGPIGVVAAATGVEMVTGKHSEGKAAEWGGLGSGIFGQFFSSPGEDVETARRKDDSAKKIAEIYLNTHKAFAEYLENGGYNTMKKVGTEIAKNPQKNSKFTIDLLLKHEQDADQKRRLETLQKSATVTKETLADNFTEVAVQATFLEINDSKQFSDYLAHIRKTQFPN